MSTSLLFIAPLLVTLALKVNSLVGIKEAPDSLALVASVGALVAMAGNPVFGKLSDRTAARAGMRRPWMVIGLVGGSAGILIVALAPSVPVVLAGWCIAQLFYNALLAAMVAVLPDQVPTTQRGLVSGVLGVCLPIASVCGTFLVKLFTGNLLAMFLGPCAIGGFFILLFAVTLKDRRLAPGRKPAWSLREAARTFYVNPRQNPDFAWAFSSRFMFVMAYAFLVTYQAYYLLDKIGSAAADVPQQIFLGTLTQSAFVVVASLIGGKLSGRTGRRKIFVLTASGPPPSCRCGGSGNCPCPCRMAIGIRTRVPGCAKTARPWWDLAASSQWRSDGGVLIRRQRAVSSHARGNRGGPEALDHQPHAK
jgi:MFS family permease